MSEFIETIVACATPSGRSALAVVRVSGPKARGILSAMSGRIFQSRRPTLVVLKDGGQNPIDEALVTFFEGPRSYTGEDLVEISCHGNPLIVEKIIAEIVSRGTRLASPGEFTQRALANDKMRPDQVEGLDWLLNSKTLSGAQLGLRAKLGQVGASVEALREDLVDFLSYLEAELDFSEEEVGPGGRAEALSRINDFMKRISSWIQAFDRNQAFVRSCRVVLVGQPNSGKSSLFNALIGMNKAIVFDAPGTTRDLVEHEIVVSGRPLVLVDTAGLREGAGDVEQMGIERSREAVKGASAVLWVSDSGDFDSSDITDLVGAARLIRVQTKSDLKLAQGPSKGADHFVSALSGDGLELLREDLSDGPLVSAADLGLTSDRQKNLALSAVRALELAAEVIASGGALDQAVASVNEGKLKIEEIAGRVSADDVLASIFSKFCIGK